jgi:hypothetical protein
MVGKISEDPDKPSLDGTEKLAMTSGGANYGSLLSSIANYIFTALFSSSTIDASGTLAANSDSKIPTQKAVKTYVDNIADAVNAFQNKGGISCSGNPNYPAASNGWTYVVTSAGKIGGASGVNVEIGDLLICKTDGSAAGTQATVGTNWTIVQGNIDGAVIGPASSVSANLPTYSGTSGKLLQDSGVAISTDGTLASNVDTKVPTEKAVKTYVAANAVPGGSGKNWLLNPSGAVNQAGVGSQADVTYDFDQWLTLTQSNPVTVSQVADAENGTPFMMRSLQANASAQRFGRIQWLEKLFCRELRGQAVSLSARVRMSASTTLRYAVIEWTATADTITKDVVNDWTSGTFTVGNFFSGSNLTIVGAGSIALTANTLTDIAAAALGTVSSNMNNIAVFFWTDSTQAQNVTLDIAKVKLEAAATLSPFVARSYAAEEFDCRRYWEPVTYGIEAYASAAVQRYQSTVSFVPKRTASWTVTRITAPTTSTNIRSSDPATYVLIGGIWKAVAEASVSAESANAGLVQAYPVVDAIIARL